MRGIDSVAADGPWTSLRAAGVSILWGSLVGGVLLLVVRRLSGAFVAPLTLGESASAGLALAGMALLASSWSVSDLADTRKPWNAIGVIFPWLVAALGAAAVSLSQSSTAELVLLWGPLALLAPTASQRWKLASYPARFTAMLHPLFESANRSRRSDGISDYSLFKLPAGSAAPSQLLVRFEREGQDTIRGRVRAVVPRGRRTASAHVAFCPPFFESPRVTIQSQGRTRDLEVATGQVLPHGARFDVKLTRPAPRTTAMQIEFSATATLPTEEPPGPSGRPSY